MDAATLIFLSAGSGQRFQNSQWIADVGYEPVTLFVTGRKGVIVANLTLLCGQLRNSVGRSGVELRTADGSCQPILLTTVTAASIAQAIVLS